MNAAKNIPNPDELIATFAEQNNIPKNRVVSFIRKLGKMKPDIVPQELESTSPATGNSAGRVPSQESIKLRDMLRKFGQKHKGETITGVELAEKMKVNPTTLNNNMRALQKQGVVKSLGQVIGAGTRGRAPNLWKWL